MANTYTADLTRSSNMMFTRTASIPLDTSFPKTVEFWIRFKTLANGGQYIVMYSGTTGTANGLLFYYSVDGSGNQTWRFTAFGQSGQQPYTVTSALSTNTWYHVAVSCSSQTAQTWYIHNQDGTLRESGAAPSQGTAPGTSLGKFWIGSYDENTSLATDAQIDEGRIWSTNLSQATIEANMRTEITAQANLVAYWKFNNDALDSSGNGYDLTAVNGATYQSATLPFSTTARNLSFSSTNNLRPHPFSPGNAR